MESYIPALLEMEMYVYPAQNPSLHQLPVSHQTIECSGSSNLIEFASEAPSSVTVDIEDVSLQISHQMKHV
jgi:hypothetical protein